MSCALSSLANTVLNGVSRVKGLNLNENLGVEAILDAAVESGELKPGGTIVEATSGIVRMTL